MCERPILFNGEMVRAILAGRKLVTRRVVKVNDKGMYRRGGYAYPLVDGKGVCWRPYAGSGWQEYPAERLGGISPFGGVGDRLWVRESYSFPVGYDSWKPSDVPPDCDDGMIPVLYEANWREEGVLFGGDFGKLRPSIFMPRWASRISLEITELRVERLQEISEEDARAEGVTLEHPSPGVDYGSHRRAFQDLWNSINERQGLGWDVNPWVWVVGFRRVD